jgi:hypothetical protein
MEGLISLAPYHYCMGMYKGEIVELSICSQNHPGNFVELTEKQYKEFTKNKKKGKHE